MPFRTTGQTSDTSRLAGLVECFSIFLRIDIQKVPSSATAIQRGFMRGARRGRHSTESAI